MDLSKLSTDDLKALQAGDLSKVSTQGLRALHTQAVLAASPPTVYDPTEGMSTTDKVLAGAGKAFYDLARGSGQLLRDALPKTAADTLGLPTQADIDEDKRLDASLMSTGAGKVGNIGGDIALMLPAAFVPGAATIPGGAALGAATGFLQPVASDDSRLKNTAIGAAGGAGGVVAGRAIKAGASAIKALIDPFTESGRAGIAGRTLARFADDPSTIANASSKPTVTGALPTLAEQTGDAGIARLQDALRSADPQFNNQIGQRLVDNNAARVNALQSLAGDSMQRTAATAARDTAAAPLYEKAIAQTTPITPELQALLQRPSMQKAITRAANMAQEQGRPFGLSPKSGTISGQTLQDLKMGMDALLSDPTSGIAGKEAAAVKGTRDSLVDAMEQAIPDFKAARQAYAAGSKPLNAMDVGAEIARRATSNTSDLAGNPRLQANALLGTLRDPQGLIERATGRKGLGNALTDVLSPDQSNLLNAVASEADRSAAVASAGNGPGSGTAQRLSSQNLLHQIIGPTGLPKSWAESVLANTIVGKPFNLIYGGVAEPKIQQALAQAVLDPESARAVLKAAAQQGITLPPSAMSKLTAQAVRATPSALAAQRDR